MRQKRASVGCAVDGCASQKTLSTSYTELCLYRIHVTIGVAHEVVQPMN